MTTENINTVDKLRCIDRELTMRHHVYPKWIAAGKMTQGQADREIAIMEAIRADYNGRVEEMKKVAAELNKSAYD